MTIKNFNNVISNLELDKSKAVESIEITIGRKYVRFIEYKEMSFIKRVRRAFINS